MIVDPVTLKMNAIIDWKLRWPRWSIRRKGLNERGHEIDMSLRMGGRASGHVLHSADRLVNPSSGK